MLERRNGGTNGESKHWQGRFYKTARKPKDVIVWRWEQCDGLVCVSVHVKCYHNNVLQFRKDHQHFFVPSTIFSKPRISFSKMSILEEIKYHVMLVTRVRPVTYLGLSLEIK